MSGNANTDAMQKGNDKKLCRIETSIKPQILVERDLYLSIINLQSTDVNIDSLKSIIYRVIQLTCKTKYRS